MLLTPRKQRKQLKAVAEIRLCTETPVSRNARVAKRSCTEKTVPKGPCTEKTVPKRPVPKRPVPKRPEPPITVPALGTRTLSPTTSPGRRHRRQRTAAVPTTSVEAIEELAIALTTATAGEAACRNRPHITRGPHHSSKRKHIACTPGHESLGGRKRHIYTKPFPKMAKTRRLQEPQAQPSSRPVPP